jgi:hypothetical protein
MSLVEHARRELELCGQYEEDPAFADSIVKAVEGFTSYGHSGGSAAVGVSMLHDLLMFKPLSPLSSDPEEWRDMSAYTANDEPLWQNVRNPSVFSTDGGKTWYDIDDSEDVTDDERDS